MVAGERIERRLAAILAADVVGYSRLMGTDEVGTLAALKTRRREIVDPKIAEYGGRIVKTTGDGLLVEFSSVVQATRCAVEIQEGLRESNLPAPEASRITFRIGINIGDVIVEDGDIFGDGVNIAARLEQIAAPGGIAISNRVYEDVRDRLAIEFEDRGDQQFKNIARPVRVWHWDGRSQGSELPLKSTPEQLHQEIAYCRAPDGVRLAFATIGQGYPVVKAGGFLCHLEHEWEIWGPAWTRFAATGRKFIRYDARGNGLSDWEVADLSHEAWVRDLETVADAAGLDRFALIGFSQGCATAIDYAVRHPDRVSHLILYGGYARGAFRQSNKEVEEKVRAQATLMRSGWLSPTPAFRQIFSTMMLPDMSPVQAKAFDHLLRHTCTGELAERYQLACGTVDVTHLLHRVTTPTLVLHVRDDAMVAIDRGREMAAGIPGARFVAIPGRNHVPLPGEPTGNRCHEEIDRFLSQTLEPKPNSKPIETLTVVNEALQLPDKPSIAVLPFQNMSGDPEQEYFADGMVEDIITALSKFKSLFVIARNSSFTYKGKAVDIRKVGRELGVRYVLEGSVRKSGNRVRVTGQLIEATTDKHLWADKFDGALEDVFDLQDQITATVVGLIAPQIEEAEIERARKKSTNSLDSYDCYLRGLAHYYKREWEEARALFANALELDPEFAAAYAMGAVTLHMQQGAGGQPLTTEMRAEALRLANIGAQLGSEDAFVLARCGHTLVYLGNEFDRGAAMVEKALSLNPNLATARASLGWISVITCDPKRAIENFQLTIRLNPLDMMRVGSSAGIAWGLWLQGRYDEGVALGKSVATIHPHVQVFGSLLANCVAARRIEEARAAAAELIKLDPSLRASRAHEIFPLRNAEYRSRLAEALRAAGLPE